MLNWLDELKIVIEENYEVGQRFALCDIYRFEKHFKRLFPGNRHIQDKLRQKLQELRDRGNLRFIDNQGMYERVT